ncbi:hypothetical protein PDIDSM_6958 [Penicillium digitatum]|nr:hypothetical protein PDIDSM_6958 [Penicillium digitatum]
MGFASQFVSKIRSRKRSDVRRWLRQQWRQLDRGLDRNTDIDKWLTSWETMQKWCKRAKMPEANDVKNQFLDAISVMSPNFHETWVLRLQDKGDIEFTELLNRYKAHWKITYGKQASQRGSQKQSLQHGKVMKK